MNVIPKKHVVRTKLEIYFLLSANNDLIVFSIAKRAN